MERYHEEVKAVRLSDNTQFDLPITVEENEVYTLSVTLGAESIQAQQEDIFPAFEELRDLLLARGVGLKCYGAMNNAHQSQMMTPSDKVYLLTMGRPALLKDVRRIFDYADLKEFVDSAARLEFSKRWLATPLQKDQ